MARRYEGLLDLPNEILVNIIGIVADQDVEARGDILALSAICHSIRTLTYGHVKEFLDIRNRYRHLVIEGRSTVMLQLLLDIQAGKSFHWHVRSIHVMNLKGLWSQDEMASGSARRTSRILLQLKPMLQEAGFGTLWSNKWITGLETPVLGLLLVNLPNLESIEPAYFQDYFIKELAIGNRNGKGHQRQPSPLLSTLEPLTVGYKHGEVNMPYGSGHGPAAIFSGKHHPIHTVRESSRSRRKQFVDNLEFKDLRTGPQGFRSLLPRFPHVKTIKLNCCQHHTLIDLGAVRAVLQDCLGQMLKDITFTTSQNHSRLGVGSFASFPALQCLRLDLNMLVGPHLLRPTSLADLLPRSIRLVHVLKISGKDSFKAQAERLFCGFDVGRFPALAEIYLEFNTDVEDYLSSRMMDLSDGLSASAIEFSVSEFRNAMEEFENRLEVNESGVTVKLATTSGQWSSGRAFYSLVHLHRPEAGKQCVVKPEGQEQKQ